MLLSALTKQDIRTFAYIKSFQKGQIYYEQGKVTSFYIIAGDIVATVRGTFPYHISIDQNMEASCSCPYDQGGWCKHLVAVCLQYLDHKNTVGGSENSGEVMEDYEHEDMIEWSAIKETLRKRKKDKLISFIVEHCNDPALLASLIHTDTHAGYSSYVTELQRLFEREMGSARYGYISYGHDIDFTKYFDAVYAALEARAYEKAKDIAQALMEVIDKNIEHCDDSEGYYGQERNQALEAYITAAPEIMSKADIFAYLIKQSDNSSIFEIEYRDAAESICSSPEDRSLFADSLQDVVLEYEPADDSLGNRHIHSKFLAYCKALLHSNQLDSFRDIAEKYYQTNDKLALMYIQALHTHKNTELALETAYKFLRFHEHHRNMFREIKTLMISRHISNDQHDRAIVLLLKMVKDGKQLEDYHNLKSIVPKKNRELIYRQIEKTCTDTRFLIDMYLLEGEKDKARQCICSAGQTRAYVSYERHFIADYPEQYFMIYKNEFEQKTTYSQDRRIYKQRAAELKRLKTIPGHADEAEIFITSVKERYPGRSAMLQEFKKAGL